MVLELEGMKIMLKSKIARRIKIEGVKECGNYFLYLRDKEQAGLTRVELREDRSERKGHQNSGEVSF